MKKNIGKQLGVLLAAMLLVSIMFAPSVSAQSDKNKIKQIDPYTYVADNKVSDKKKFLDKNEPLIDQKHNISTGQVTSQAENSGNDRATQNLLGSYIEGKTYFHGILDSELTTVTFTGDGYTKGYWWGSNPYYADRITLGSQVVISGISVTLSVPPSAGFSVSDNTATYSGSWDNVYWAAHYYSNLVATSNIAITDQDQYDGETFRFGNEDYTLYTHVDL